jgi:Dolichyl-phosphate-mannose-protein mannosyltransferase
MRGVQPAATITQLNRRRLLAVHLLILLGFFLLVMLLGLWAKPFQYDPDEGLNLMKAALLSRGYPLYRAIWNDQPPMDTVMRAGVFAVVGRSALAARVMTALLATLAVWAMLDIVTRLHSLRAGVAAVALLIVSAHFLKLSYAVMIGLPALAVATVSFNLLSRWTTRGSRVALIGSAAVMAVAIATKMFAAVMVPAALAMIWMTVLQRDAKPKARFVPMLAWIAATLICCAIIYAIFRPPFDQLITPHRSASEARPWWSAPAALLATRRDSDLLLLAVGAAALLLIGRTQNRYLAVPLIWLACAAVAVQMHRPVRYHHSLLLVIPAAWAGGIFVDAMMALHDPARRWSSRVQRVALGAFLIVLPVWQAGKFIAAARRMMDTKMRREERALVAAMSERRDQTRWVVTDLQIYPFAAGLLSPPELVVTSSKRRDTGAMSDEFVLDVLQRYRPEQVLLGRFDFGPMVRQFVDANYHLVGRYKIGTPEPARLYLIGKDPTAAATQPAKRRKKRATPATTQATQPVRDSPVQVN